MASPCDILNREQRPPLGLEPEYVHEHAANLARVRAITAAIERYVEASKIVPESWFEELQRRAPCKTESDHSEFFQR
jgi:hypothetical protein